MVDWTHVLVAVIAGLPATIAAIGAVLASLRNGNKADSISTKIDRNTNQIAAKIDDNTVLTKEGNATITADVQKVVKATNGISEKIVAAELVAERVVAKAEVAAKGLLDSAASTAKNLSGNATTAAKTDKLIADYETVWRGFIMRGFVEAKKMGCLIGEDPAFFKVSQKARNVYLEISPRLQDICTELKETKGKDPSDEVLSLAIEHEFQAWMGTHACPELGLNQHGCLAIACVIARE